MIKASQFLEYFQTELVEKLEDLLGRFYKDMIGSGLKPVTAERHIANTELFLIEYHAFYFLDDINTLRPEKIYDFLGLWYFQRINEPSENDLLGILTSLKKFFQYIDKQGILPQSICRELKSACNDKKYFTRRYHQYEYNHDLCFLPSNPSKQSRKLTLRDFANQMSKQDMDERSIEEILEGDTGLSLEEMIEQLIRRFHSFHPESNVISLEPIFNQKNSLKTQKQSSDKSFAPSINTLKKHCMDIHRVNLVFMRWLDRYNCQIGDLPAEAIAACLDCDGLLASLLAQLNVELISCKEIELGHQLLDLMDKMLWKARFQITQRLNLDLRSFPI